MPDAPLYTKASDHFATLPPEEQAEIRKRSDELYAAVMRSSKKCRTLQYRPNWVRYHIGRRVLLLGVRIVRPTYWRSRIGTWICNLGLFINGHRNPWKKGKTNA